MEKEVFFLSQLAYLVISVNCSYYVIRGLWDKSAWTKAIGIVGTLAAGTALAYMVAQYTAAQTGGLIPSGFGCARIADHYYSCGGWPLIGDFVGNMVSGLAVWFRAATGIPTVAAPLLANLYILKKISEDISLTSLDIMKAFFTGFVVYFTLTHTTAILGWYDGVLEKITGFASADAGRGNLRSWIETLTIYMKYATSGHGFMSFPYLLLAVTFLFGLVINIGGIVIFTTQFVMLSFLPIHVFRGLLFHRSHFSDVLTSLGAVAVLGVIDTILWAFLGALPSIDPPPLVGRHYVFSNEQYYQTVALVLLGFVIGIIYYGFILFNIKRVLAGMVFLRSKI